MTLLAQHLENIHLSAETISAQEFDTSRVFTNALLYNNEITALIRDTEPHEHGLFACSDISAERVRRQTTVNSARPPPHSAVARVLGSDLLKRIQRSNRGSDGSRGVDIEVLLQGVERLCSVYNVQGAQDRVVSLRQRHQKALAGVKQYEERLATQEAKLKDSGNAKTNDTAASIPVASSMGEITTEDLLAEEEAIRELDMKKKALEQRLAEMGKDLG